jgi:LPS-assembly protein
MRRGTIPWMAGSRGTSWHRAGRAAVLLTWLATAFVLFVPEPVSAQINNGFNTGGTSRTPRDQLAFGRTRAADIVGPVRRGDKSTPLYLNADELEYDTRNNRVIARGNVEIYYNNYALKADRVVYDQGANTITAEGNAKFYEPDEPGRPGAVIQAERLVTTADFAEAFAQTISVIGKDDTRIAGVRVVRRDGNILEFEKGKFTPCKSDPGKPPLWCIAAEKVIHDKGKQTITYQDAQFELFGVPILYLPYFQHADPSVKSKSGFLLPEYSSYSRLGLGVEVPYHFALNPSYDFLFHPMYLSKQGILWQGEWRQKVRIGQITGQYNIKLAGIEQNNDQSINAALHDRWRGSVQSRGAFSLSSWWAFGWDVIGETDKAFRQFYRLDNVLQRDRVNSLFLAGRSDRNFFGLTMYHVGGLVLNERLDTLPPGTPPSMVPANLSQAAPSRVAPVMDYNYVFANPLVGGELRMNMNAVSYWQDLTFIDAQGFARRADSNAHRFTANMNWRRTLIDPLGQTYTPFAEVRGDVISFRETVNPLSLQVQPEETVTRGVASAGLLYSYPWVMAAAGATHTVEPVGQIIARNASVDQRRLPDIDCRSTVFSDENLFEWSKANCYDRIDTGVRVNYGLQYTFQANAGGSMRVLAGQSQHLSGDNIFRNPGVDSDNRFLYSPASGLERRASDYVLGLYVSPLSGFRSVTQARFDEDTRDLKRLDSLLGFNYGPVTSQVSYAFTAASPALNLLNDQQELIAMLGLRVTENWSIIGQTRYSLDANRPIQNIAALKYQDECYVMSINYIETHLTDPTRDLRPDRSILFRFELKHLGEFRYKTNVLDQLFSENPLGGQQR